MSARGVVVGVAARPLRVRYTTLGEAYRVMKSTGITAPVAVINETVKAGSLSALFPLGPFQGMQS